MVAQPGDRRAVAHGRRPAPGSLGPDRRAGCWVRAKRLGLPVVPFFFSLALKRVRGLEGERRSGDVELTAADLETLDPLGDSVVGARY